jgi:hypothetical protein
MRHLPKADERCCYSKRDRWWPATNPPAHQFCAVLHPDGPNKDRWIEAPFLYNLVVQNHFVNVSFKDIRRRPLSGSCRRNLIRYATQSKSSFPFRSTCLAWTGNLTKIGPVDPFARKLIQFLIVAESTEVGFAIIDWQIWPHWLNEMSIKYFCSIPRDSLMQRSRWDAFFLRKQVSAVPLGPLGPFLLIKVPAVLMDWCGNSSYVPWVSQSIC